MARYAGLLIAPAEGFGLWPTLFVALWAKKEINMLFWTIFGNFWCPVVTLVTISSNISNFERNSKNQKYPKKIQNFKKKFKKSKSPKKSKKSKKKNK